MYRCSRLACLAPALVAAGVAHAFPDGATSPTKDEIRQRLTDKVFTSAFSPINTVRLEFKSNGYFFFNTATGGRGSGEWSAEDAKLCSKMPGSSLSCNDVRIFEDRLYLKRDNGDIVRYDPK